MRPVLAPTSRTPAARQSPTFVVWLLLLSPARGLSGLPGLLLPFVLRHAAAAAATHELPQTVRHGARQWCSGRRSAGGCCHVHDEAGRWRVGVGGCRESECGVRGRQPGASAGAECTPGACPALREDDRASASVQGRGPAAAPKAQPCNEITDKLFLGTKACAEDVHELTSRDIVVTIAVGEGLQLDEAEVRAARGVVPRAGRSAHACATRAERARDSRARAGRCRAALHIACMDVQTLFARKLCVSMLYVPMGSRNHLGRRGWWVW